jgi:hypothetical protein
VSELWAAGGLANRPDIGREPLLQKYFRFSEPQIRAIIRSSRPA